MRSLPLALALALAPSVASAQPAAAASTSAAGSSKAIALLDASMPMADLQKQLLDGFLADFAKGIDRNAQLAQMEARKPGLRDALKTAIASEMNRVLPLELAHLKGAVAAIYDKALTQEDMDTALAFFLSPAGKRYSEKVSRSALANTAEMAASNQLTPQNFDNAVDKLSMEAGIAGLQGISAEDVRALQVFANQPAYRKIEQADPEITALVHTELQGISGRVSEKIGSVVTITTFNHMYGTKK